MGSGSSRKVSCPKCNFRTSNGTTFISHLAESHGFTEGIPSRCDNDTGTKPIANIKAFNNPITCPKCSNSTLLDETQLVKHLKKQHAFNDQNNIPCPKCTADEDFKNSSDLLEHLEKSHGFGSTQESILCPKCDKELKGTNEFLGHLQTFHMFLPSSINVREDERNINKNLPKVGDKILAMWSESVWQYFHATIVSFKPESLRYLIDWDDGDTTGRIVDYFNIAVDKIPEENEIGVGSIILFPQGAYTAGATQLTGGKRWHQGRITKIHKNENQTLYDGVHTKGREDGKFVTYRSYSYEFKGLNRNDFRVGPNVFDILGDEDEPVDVSNIDIYISYTNSDSPSAIKSKKISNVPSSIMSKIDQLCDPIDIVSVLKSKGLKVASVDGENDSNKGLKEKVTMLKNSKVFIACISDQYVLNEQCRMEFQYAKSTLRKPVVPLVLGEGTEWMMSVVGMLIAGELYIHFKDKTVQDSKSKEMFDTLVRHIPNVPNEQNQQQQEQTADDQEGTVFMSYCWTNSYIAEQNKQINKVNGTKFSDPRLIKDTITDFGYSTWMDIERLQSANENAGLFEQIVKGLKNAKVVIAFVSSDYTASVNCRMEFQFAFKSLNKKVIPVIVGTGEDWKESVVGALLNSNEHEVINFQNISNNDDFALKTKELQNKLNSIFNIASEATQEQQVKPLKSRAPKVGDHVVCHHFNYCYYMATVVSYKSNTMEYTVDWDDGDPSGRAQSYKQLAIDNVPDADDVGVGSNIFFPQGRYVGGENNTGGIRYHEGVISSLRRNSSEVYIDGHHLYTAEDGKQCRYKEYSHEFKNISLSEIRIAPSALDIVL